MNIYVWNNFSKRKNSTKQPTGGTTIDVKLKDNCSQESPVFILTGAMPDYTYVSAFGNYYFVTDIVNINAGMCEVHCKKDVLASHKSEIGSTSAFILYDETANTVIEDKRLAKTYIQSRNASNVQLHGAMSRTGTIVATITGEKSTYCYLIDPADVAKLIPDISTQVANIFAGDYTPQGILDMDFVPTIISAIKQLVSSSSLSGNIRDVRWVPFSFSGLGSFGVNVGMYDTGIQAGRVNMTGLNRIDSRSVNISIPWTLSGWRRAYCTDVYMRIPFVGCVSFPAHIIAEYDNLNILCSVDIISGDMAVEVWAGSHMCLGSYGASTGVTIPIGNASPSLSKIFTTFMQGLTPLSGVGSIGGIFEKGIGNARDMAQAMFTPLTQTVGGIGSSAGIGLPFDVELVVIGHDTTVSPSSVASVIGTPTMAVKTISSLSGYIQCQDASVSINGHDSERDEINSFLNSGFFYE